MDQNYILYEILLDDITFFLDAPSCEDDKCMTDQNNKCTSLDRDPSFTPVSSHLSYMRYYVKVAQSF